MGLKDLTARSPEAYVALAVRRAADRDYREAVCRRIAERSEVLFEDSGAIREHDAFFDYALGRARDAEG